jgi:hypothetical protein
VVGRDPCLLASLVSPDHVGRDCKTLEILGVQLPLAMSRRQFGERVTPHPPLEQAASLLRSAAAIRITICLAQTRRSSSWLSQDSAFGRAAGGFGGLDCPTPAS